MSNDLGRRLTALADAAYGPQDTVPVSTVLESVAYAHLADAVSEVTGNDDYDEVARDAAYLASRSESACAIANEYAGGRIGEPEFQAIVRSAIQELVKTDWREQWRA